MYCPRCNAKNLAEASFCEECGMTLMSPQTEVLGEPVFQRSADTIPQFTPPGADGQEPYTAYSVPPYQYPGYPYGAAPFNPGERPFRGWASVLGLVIGILSMPSCFCGFAITMSISDTAIAISLAVNLLIAISGIVFSGIGTTGAKKGIGIAGLVCSIVSAAIALFLLVLALLALMMYI